MVTERSEFNEEELSNTVYDTKDFYCLVCSEEYPIQELMRHAHQRDGISAGPEVTSKVAHAVLYAVPFIEDFILTEDEDGFNDL